MKKLLIIFGIISVTLIPTFAQSKKADGNLVYVIISLYPKTSFDYRFWGTLLPRSESNYRRLPGEV